MIIVEILNIFEKLVNKQRFVFSKTRIFARIDELPSDQEEQIFSGTNNYLSALQRKTFKINSLCQEKQCTRY